MRELVQGMDFRRERVRLALTTFAGEVNYIFNLTTYTQKEDILNSININKVQQETDIASALQAVRENVLIGKNGNRNGVPDNVILMSDGRATQRRNDVQMEADKLKAENVRMYVVGVGNGIDSGVLSGIASSPTSSNEFNIISREDVEDKAFDLLDELCQWFHNPTFSTNTRGWPTAALMFDQHRGRWTNIRTTLAQCLVSKSYQSLLDWNLNWTFRLMSESLKAIDDIWTQHGCLAHLLRTQPSPSAILTTLTTQ